jgi:LemA protein
VDDKKKKTVGILLGLTILFLIVAFNYTFVQSTYNRMVDLQEITNSAWADVENNLQRRFDLIPNLVNTVKGYADQEKEVLLGVTEARARVGSAGTRDERIQAEQGMTGALSRLLLVVENYPQLKSDQNFRALQDELAGTENRLAVSRKRFNDAIQRYNVAIRQFPANIVARIFDFETRKFYETSQEAQQNPVVEF